jgi:O-acetyl-ADP-ribose deacetylase (regulator of RNase III)
MKIIYKMGNLMEAAEPCIAHGCNAQGVMGSGVALAIRKTFPDAFRVYERTYIDGHNHLQMGTVAIAHTKGKLIANCITQEYFGPGDRRYVSYDAISLCLQMINNYKIDSVALPLIGAGLGGGNWNIIATIIEEELTKVQPVVYVLSEEDLKRLGIGKTSID